MNNNHNIYLNKNKKKYLQSTDTLNNVISFNFRVYISLQICNNFKLSSLFDSYYSINQPPKMVKA